MYPLLLILFLFSCSPIFLTESNLTSMWLGKESQELIDILGPYSRIIDNVIQNDNKILIWEANKDNLFIPIEKIGAKNNKLGTSISSIHVYIDNNEIITEIKKSLY